MDYRAEIRLIAMQRNIRYLLHFTQAANLPGIVQHGLLPRRELKKPAYLAYSSDKYRLDDNDDAISVSVSRFNQAMFAAKRHKSGHPEWIILILSPEILWTLTCRFFWRNAATREMRACRGNYGAWSFSEMFAGGENVRSGLPPEFPTCIDAEVEVLEGIPASYILGVAVNRPTMMVRVRNVLDAVDGGPREVITCDF